jgi:hypothetical protein
MDTTTDNTQPTNDARAMSPREGIDHMPPDHFLGTNPRLWESSRKRWAECPECFHVESHAIVVHCPSEHWEQLMFSCEGCGHEWGWRQCTRYR